MNLENAVGDVQNKYCTVYEASTIYDVRQRTVKSRLAYALQFGVSDSLPSTGRKPIFSDEVIEAEKQKTRALDCKLRSRRKADWGSYFHDLQRQNHKAGDPPIQLISKNSIRLYRNLIAPEKCSTYDQNEARTAALEDLYSHIAWVACLRCYHGFLSSTSALGILSLQR